MSGVAGFMGAEAEVGSGGVSKEMPPESTLKYMRAMGVEAFWEMLGCRCQQIVAPQVTYATSVAYTTTPALWLTPSGGTVTYNFETKEEYVVDATSREDLWPERKNLENFVKKWNFEILDYGVPHIGDLSFDRVIYVRNNL